MKARFAAAVVVTSFSWMSGLSASDAIRSVGNATAPTAAGHVVPAAPSGQDGGTESLLAEGIALRRAGDDRGALELFQKAWQRSRSPRALAQMALAEQALGRWVDAYGHLQQVLANDSDPWIAEYRDVLALAVADVERQLGALEVWCNVDGASVYLDGHRLGRTPLTKPLKLVAGKSVIGVSAPGHFEVTRLVNVDPGDLARVEIQLTPKPAVAAARANYRANDAAAATSSRDLLIYGSAGLAGLGLTLGVTGYITREVNIKLYNDDSRCAPEPSVPRSVTCPDEAAAWRRGEVVAIAGFASAGIFGGLALYLWLERPSHKGSTELACGTSLTSVVCAGRF